MAGLRYASRAPRRGSFAASRVRLVAVALAAAALTAGCSTIGPSVHKVSGNSAELEREQAYTADQQILTGLLITPEQMGTSWGKSALTPSLESEIGQTGFEVCGVGLDPSYKPELTQETYVTDGSGGWIANQVLIYDNDSDAQSATKQIGNVTPTSSCAAGTAPGPGQSYTVNGAPVQASWLNGAAGLVTHDSQTTAIVAQTRGRFVSVIYGPATQDGPDSLTFKAAQAATTQLGLLTETDAGPDISNNS